MSNNETRTTPPPGNSPVPTGTQTFQAGNADARIEARHATGGQPLAERPDGTGGTEPDVLIDVPELSVESIELEVESLKANVALDARLGNLLLISAGAHAGMDNVKLSLKGVRAQILSKVKLDNLMQILERTLTTIDRNPQVLGRLLRGVDRSAGAGREALRRAKAGNRELEHITQPGGLLSQTKDRAGHTVQRVVDRTGYILERLLGGSGEVLEERTIASVADLPVVSEREDEAGHTVRILRDTSGALLEVTEQGNGRARVHIVKHGPGVG